MKRPAPVRLFTVTRLPLLSPNPSITVVPIYLIPVTLLAASNNILKYRLTIERSTDPFACTLTMFGVAPFISFNVIVVVVEAFDRF